VQSDYNLILEALLIYQRFNGDLCVPSSFVVPCAEPWPQSVWKMPLGARVSAMRSRNHHLGTGSKRRKQLADMGFVWEASDPLWERFYSALEAYHNCHGDTLVPRGYVVSRDDVERGGGGDDDGGGFSESALGFKLGQAVANLRSKRTFRIDDYPHRLKALERLNFVFDLSEHGYQQLTGALSAYRMVYGHLRVPQTFVVPAQAPWPSECWGYTLGARVSAVRTRGGFVKNSPKRLRELNQLGFQWNPPRGRRATELRSDQQDPGACES
jgi:hypothetical protein